MPHFVSTLGARLMGQPLYRILTAPWDKETVNTGKPHNASESFCSQVAYVTSGYISLAKESRMTNSDISKRKSIILPQNGAVNILNTIAIYHRPTKQKYEAKNLDINENEKGKLQEMKDKTLVKVKELKKTWGLIIIRPCKSLGLMTYLGYFINDL